MDALRNSKNFSNLLFKELQNKRIEDKRYITNECFSSNVGKGNKTTFGDLKYRIINKWE